MEDTTDRKFQDSSDDVEGHKYRRPWDRTKSDETDESEDDVEGHHRKHRFH